MQQLRPHHSFGRVPSLLTQIPPKTFTIKIGVADEYFSNTKCKHTGRLEISLDGF